MMFLEDSIPKALFQRVVKLIINEYINDMVKLLKN